MGMGVDVGVAVGGKGVGVHAAAVIVAISSGEGPQAASKKIRIHAIRNDAFFIICLYFIVTTVVKQRSPCTQYIEISTRNQQGIFCRVWSKVSWARMVEKGLYRV
jgi:hypothetical protein